ncbi:MAG: C40 family peptidase [Bacteroidales bacterium]|nr:C40 family peptidase [Bacteroidales bacterium]
MASYGIALLALIPMRKNPNESSEMVSELMFGEVFSILKEDGSWAFIENKFDFYHGWIDRAMITEISEAEADALINSPVYIVRNPLTDIKCKGDNSPFRISMGSVLPGYIPNKNSFTVAERTFKINSNQVVRFELGHLKSLLRTASLYMHTPYLWGGRSIMGADCSGFVQSVYRLNGVALPRDADQQCLLGEPIKGIENSYPGDLVFFENSLGNVVHVGMMFTKDMMIHCSGSVHLSKITNEGYWSDLLNDYVKRKPIIRRFNEIERKR